MIIVLLSSILITPNLVRSQEISGSEKRNLSDSQRSDNWINQINTTKTLIEDPKGDNEGEPFTDILSASIKQIDKKHYQLSMNLNANPKNFEPPGKLTYIFHLDTDKNSETGQPHGEIGSEYNIRIFSASNSSLRRQCTHHNT